jgi:hypothetical protein
LEKTLFLSKFTYPRDKNDFLFPDCPIVKHLLDLDCTNAPVSSSTCDELESNYITVIAKQNAYTDYTRETLF